MTDSTDINKAVSACRNLAKQFRSFSKVADVLEELGDVEKRLENGVKDAQTLDDMLTNMDKRKFDLKAEIEQAEKDRDGAVSDRDKELEAQEAVAEDIKRKARDEAAQIVATARNEADAVMESLAVAKLEAEGELSRVKVAVDEVQLALAALKEEMAALKERL